MTAYLQQVARAYRFLDRYLGAMTFVFEDDPNKINDLEDYLWACLQNCWHIKDWIRHDESIPQDTRNAVWEAVKHSKWITIVADLANGSKHLATNPNREWVGAAEASTQIIRNPDGTSTFTHYVELPHGSRISIAALAQSAMQEWQNILKTHGLSYFSGLQSPS